MKKIVYSAALLSMLSLATVGCQKDTIAVSGVTTEEFSESRLVRYSIDGITHETNTSNEEDYNSLIDMLVALAKEGRNVTFWREDVTGTLSPTKDIVTFTTTSEVEAAAWSKNMMDHGYTVNISYNTKTGIYTCTAIK